MDPLFPDAGTIDNRTSLLTLPDGQRLPLLYLSGQVGSPGQDLLVDFVSRLGIPLLVPDAQGVLAFAPATMQGWEVRVTSAGWARLYCPAPYQGEGVQYRLHHHCSIAAVPDCLQAARDVECALLIAGPPLPFAEGAEGPADDVFKFIGQRPVAGGLIPVNFEDAPASSTDRTSRAQRR